MLHRKDLAAALLEEHAVRPEALERLRREQQRTGRPLWALLVEAGLCTDDAIFLALRRWSGAPALSAERLAGLRVPAELREAIPKELASAEGVLPLECSPDGRRVALAMVDPLADAATVRAALGRAGVVEVHRFLLHRAVLLRCIGRLYGEARPAELPLSEQPTGMVRLPEPGGRLRRRPRGDETELLPGRGAGRRGPLLSPPVQPRAPAPARPAAVTQPLPPVQPVPQSSVQVDPELLAEIERLEAGEARGPASGPQASQGPEGVGARRDLTGPLAAALRSLATAAERLLRPGTPRLGELAELTARAAGALGWPAPRAEELGLLGQLQGTERLLLLRAHTAEQGRTLGAALRALQAALLPEDEAGDRGRRLLAASAAAQELHLSGVPEAALGAALVERAGVGEVTEAVLQALRARPLAAPEPRRPIEETTPVLAWEPDDPERTREVPLPLPEAPSDAEFEIELADVSDAGLEAYHYEEK